MNGLTISRFVGLLTAVGLCVWAALAFSRFAPERPVFALFLLVGGLSYAVFLALPWSRIKGALLWKGLFACMMVGIVLLAVLLIGEVAYTQAIAIELKTKARPPMLEGALLFLSLLQVPTVFFVRYPNLLE